MEEELRRFYARINESYETAVRYLGNERIIVKTLAKNPLKKGMERIVSSLESGNRKDAAGFAEDLCVTAKQIGFVNYAGLLNEFKKAIESDDAAELGMAYSMAQKGCDERSSQINELLKTILD